MKTFQQFCEDAYQLNEFKIGNPLNNPLIKKAGGLVLRGLGAVDALNPKETPVNRTSGVLSVVKPFSPVTMAVGLGSQVLAPAAIELAKQREKARQARLYQLVPGKTDVSGKPAQIRPLKKT